MGIVALVLACVQFGFTAIFAIFLQEVAVLLYSTEPRYVPTVLPGSLSILGVRVTHQQLLTLAVAGLLVGLLHTCEIRLSPELEERAHAANQWTPVVVEARTVEDAASIVAFVFKLDRRQVLAAFQTRWQEARESLTAQRLRDRLLDHRFVGDLRPRGEFP